MNCSLWKQVENLYFFIMDIVISAMLNFQIEVLSLSTDIKSCKSECSKLEGHLPYSIEGQCLLGGIELWLCKLRLKATKFFYFENWPFLKLVTFLTKYTSMTPLIDPRLRFLYLTPGNEYETTKEMLYSFWILNLNLKIKVGRQDFSKFKKKIGQCPKQLNINIQF